MQLQTLSKLSVVGVSFDPLVQTYLLASCTASIVTLTVCTSLPDLRASLKQLGDRCKLFYCERVDKKLKGLTRQQGDDSSIVMSPIPAGDEEYVAIGKVIAGAVKIQGGRPELRRTYQEALQAYVYGAQARIEELQVQVSSDEEEVKVDDTILKETA